VWVGSPSYGKLLVRRRQRCKLAVQELI